MLACGMSIFFSFALGEEYSCFKNSLLLLKGILFLESDVFGGSGATFSECPEYCLCKKRIYAIGEPKMR